MTARVVALVYPYKHRPQDDGEELRLSLRSVETYLHLTGVTDVMPVVVGTTPPTWLDPSCFVRSEGEIDGGDATKTHNTVRAVLNGLRHIAVPRDGANLAAECLYMNDDFVLLEPRTDVLDLWNADTEEIWRNVNRVHSSMAWWREGMTAARTWCTRAGIAGPLNWEMHLPMWLRRDRAGDLCSALLTQTPDPVKVPFLRTTYGNLVGYDRPVYPARDVLATDHSYGSSWISLHDTYSRKWLFRETMLRLPAPSRWERP